MKSSAAIFLAKTPFARLLAPLMAGIILQWYLQLPIMLAASVFVISLIVIILFFFDTLFRKLKYQWLQGFFIFIMIAALGMLLVNINDTRQRQTWFGKKYKTGAFVVATIEETIVEKAKSYKAEAIISDLFIENERIATTGKIIIYFKKDSAITQLSPGSRIMFNRPLQEIKNSGNPGSFDYRRYALFNGITHQLYLTPTDFEILPGKNISWFQSFLNNTRAYVLQSIKTYIPGKKEQGLAEALLIGYKDDLDKNLLQSYTNTGVVHVIAVSGMHLALIYWVLNLLFKPLLRIRQTQWLHPVLVLSILWIFSLLAGGAASIIRAAVMFTFIMIGKTLKRNASIYNTLAGSAFCLLCYNPYWLWDVGFQLSYMAVLSIVVFYKPIYGLLFIKNKILNWVWKLVAVSTAAQILTTPFSMYHFHQFPVYFLITNLVAVPMSGGILIGELILVILSPIKFIAAGLGKVLSAFIWWLNTFIERLEKFPFALWDGLLINIPQAILLLIAMGAIGFWLIEKIKPALWIGVAAIVSFFAIRTYSFYEASKQQKIIVYNVPKNRAVDFVDGRNYLFVGDSAVLKDDYLRNFHIKPSRVANRVQPADTLQHFSKMGNAAVFHNKKIIFINSEIAGNVSTTPVNADLVILSGNPRLFIYNLQKMVVAKQIVIDGSVPSWKAKYWKKDCDSLHIPFHDVAEKGAFVMSIR